MRTVKRHPLLSRMTPLIIAAVVLSGCSVNTDPNRPATLLRGTGSGQSAAAGTVLPTPFTLIVLTQFGEPLDNITVVWSENPVAGGTLNPTTTLTAGGGVATTTYTLPPTAGQVTIQAKVSGFPAIAYTVTAT